MLKEYMNRYKNQILMFLDLHGHTKGEGIFFYACQADIPKQQHFDKTEMDQQLEKQVLVHALPAILGHHSPYFNMSENRFFSQHNDRCGGKLNTARVVGVSELGIDLSYTVESSFYSHPILHDQGQRQKGVLDRAAMMKAGSDLLMGIYNVTFTTQKLQA